MGHKAWLGILVAGLTLLTVGGAAWAADGQGQTRSMFEMFIWPGGGSIGILIILIDVASIALAIEHFLNIRRSRLLPDEVRRRVLEHARSRAGYGVMRIQFRDGEFHYVPGDLESS